MTQASCIYEGYVRHRRYAPTKHEFRQSVFLMYLDLDELPHLFAGRWLWSANRPNWAWFRRQDHLGDPREPLQDSVRALIQAKFGTAPRGPIRLLTNLRYAGFVMNPISVYYCFEESGQLGYVVAEVHNTPWGERHSYCLDVRGSEDRRSLQMDIPKTFHVSPFMGMDYDYRFRLSVPDERLTVHIENHKRHGTDDSHGRDDSLMFDATLQLQRKPISTKSLASALIRYPCMTGLVYAGIHWQALRLWWKRTPYFAHPVPYEQRRHHPLRDSSSSSAQTEIGSPQHTSTTTT